jgi:hypothetical protein
MGGAREAEQHLFRESGHPQALVRGVEQGDQDVELGHGQSVLTTQGGLTWANVQHDPLPRHARPRHAPRAGDPRCLLTSAPRQATTIKTVYSPGHSAVRTVRPPAVPHG